MKVIATNLPKELFAQKAAPALISQAVRVYLANQRQGTQSALTRAEVNRTGKKVYKQKGTGGARHGSRRAPIYVGGGATFAPKPRDHSLSMNIRMKRKALLGALSVRAAEKNVLVVSGLVSASGKTKELAQFIATVLPTPVSNVLIITDILRNNVHRAGKNLRGVTVTTLEHLTTHAVVRSNKILIMEEALTLTTPAVKTAVKAEVKEKKVVKAEKKVVKAKATVKKVAAKK